MNRFVCLTATLVIAASCAKGGTAAPVSDASNEVSDAPPDASCGDLCDRDNDGVVDGNDECPNTPAGMMVNSVGCADSQVMPTLEPMFPPYGLIWTNAGDLGRAGGLTWTYTGISREDLFHIYWIICDDPATPCGVSLDGPLDASESWQYSAADSMLAAGKVVFTNTTHILLADTSTPLLAGRLTVTIVDANDAPLPFADVAALGVTPRVGRFGAEITGTGFKVVALTEVRPSAASPWTPYLDYYDAAPTPMAGGGTTTSFGGSFYDE
jgi:hypothetical protein